MHSCGVYFSDSDPGGNSSSDDGVVNCIKSAPSPTLRQISSLVCGEYFASASEEESEVEVEGCEEAGELKGSQEICGNKVQEEEDNVQGNSDSEQSSGRLSPKAGPAQGWESHSSSGMMSNADDAPQPAKHNVKLQERNGTVNQLLVTPHRLGELESGPGSEHDAHSVSLSSINIQDPGFPMSPGASSIISTSSWPTPRSSGAAKRWGALKNLGSLQVEPFARPSGACSDGQSIQDDKENSTNQGSAYIYQELPTVQEPSFPLSAGAGAAAEGLFSENSLESTDSVHIPGLWINRIWGRKDVEELDGEICSALQEEGLDAKEYFKRDYTNFPSVAHYYVNLHERLCDRLDEDLIDLMASLTGRLGEKNPLVLAMKEVMHCGALSSQSCSGGLLVDVSLGADKEKATDDWEEGKGTYPIECSLTDSTTNLQDAAISTQDKADVVESVDAHPSIKTKVVPPDNDSIAPELVHMKRELQGLSWVIKKPSNKDQTGESVVSHQEIISSAASTGQTDSTTKETPSRFGIMPSSAAPAPGVFEIRNEVLDSDRNLRVIREEIDEPKACRSGWFQCCFS